MKCHVILKVQIMMRKREISLDVIILSTYTQFEQKKALQLKMHWLRDLGDFISYVEDYYEIYQIDQ